MVIQCTGNGEPGAIENELRFLAVAVAGSARDLDTACGVNDPDAAVAADRRIDIAAVGLNFVALVDPDFLDVGG